MTHEFPESGTADHVIGGTTTATPLMSPSELIAEHQSSSESEATVSHARKDITKVLDGADDRLVAVVGPCSVHEIDSALVYARWLRAIKDELSDDLVIVMRTYVEKPRTAVGWPGLVADPWLDGGYALEDGLRLSRMALSEITATGLPVACEWLAPLVPPYLSDLVSWGAIGARTVTSQTHRQLASGLPMPVGMKNGTDGSVRPALDAIRSAGRSHVQVGLSPTGVSMATTTSGNPHCHVVLRGGTNPNHGPSEVSAALALLEAESLPERVMIDASHGNSGKDHVRQREVVSEIATQLAGGEYRIKGVLMESFLEAGRQDVVPGQPLVFGRSITDACMGWPETANALRQLAAAVRTRRTSQRASTLASPSAR